MVIEINIVNVLNKIDEKLIAENVSIPDRYKIAIKELGIIFNVHIPIFPNMPLENNEVGNQLAIWANDWYEKKYGNKQKLNFDLGVFYINIRGDLWKYRIPCFYGTCNFYINQNLSNKGNNSSINIMCMCEDMTQSYANSLTNEDLNKILRKYQEAIEVFQIFSAWSDNEVCMLDAILADIRNVTIQLDNNFPHYGQALFSYLQAAEKIIKSWLLNTGCTSEELRKKYSHHVDKLSLAFNEKYINSIDVEAIKNLKNDRELRYGKFRDYSIEDMIKAQEALFHIILAIDYSPILKK